MLWQEARMAGQPGFFDLDERYAALSAAGDPLERLARVVDFELFRPELDAALDRSDRAKGGRPPYDPVLMFKVLILQTLYTLSDDQTEYQIRDRLSFMRFIGLALEDRVPDAKTIWLIREQLTKAGAMERLFARFDAVLRDSGYLAMGGQIVDATVIQARRPRLTGGEKATIKGGGIPETWSPAKRAQMDTEGWTLKRGPQARGWPKRGPRTDPDRARDPGVRLQEPPRHRPPARLHPQLRGDRCRRARRPPARPAARSAQHRERRLGRCRLPLGRQRCAAGAARTGAAVPATEAAWQADATAHRPRQRQPGARAGRDRARVRRAEVPAWPGDPLGRPGPGHGQARARQPGHQHDPPRLVPDPSGPGLRAAALTPTRRDRRAPIQHRPPARTNSDPDSTLPIVPTTPVLRGVQRIGSLVATAWERQVLRLQSRGLAAGQGVEIENPDQLHEQLVPVDLGLEGHEHRAEADRGAVHQHELARRRDPADLAQPPLYIEHHLAPLAARIGLLNQARPVLEQRRVHERGPKVQGLDHLLAQVFEPPRLVGAHGEVLIAALERPVQVDHALYEARPEHPDAAEVQQVDAEVRPRGVVAEVRIAVDHGVVVERHVPGAEHVVGDAVARLDRRVPELQQRPPVQPAHGEQAPGRELAQHVRHVHVGLAPQHVGVKSHVPGLALVVELLAQPLG